MRGRTNGPSAGFYGGIIGGSPLRTAPCYRRRAITATLVGTVSALAAFSSLCCRNCADSTSSIKVV